MPQRRRALPLFAAVLAVTAAACGGTSGASPASGRIRVVAAENVYGDVLQQLGGSRVEVTSILSDPNADPHLFEPGTANAAAVASAALVVQNGLGYDAFVQRLLDAAPSSTRRVVTVADVLGIRGPAANPHLWYDVPGLPAVARAFTAALIAVDAGHRPDYERRLAAFLASLRPLQDAVAALRAAHAGAPVASTEPVPDYLLRAAGLAVLTPEAFARSIEQGADPPPQAVAAMQALMSGHRIRALLYNRQATSPVTDRVRELAGRNGIPVVAVTETLPPGSSFQDWQLGQVRALARALGG